MGAEGARKVAASAASSTTDPLIGAVLADTYRVVRLMAAGGMGRVYEVEHTRLPRKLVAKLLLEAHSLNREVLERAEREARAIAAIRSDHVVEIADVIRMEDGRPCIVVDYLEGEDLNARLERQGKLPLGEAVEIARQICAGVAAAHDAGIVHRDLKPANIFLVERPEGEVVKILDFGVAKLGGGKDLTETGALVGTPAYMAPEQAMNAGAVDARADVYATGAVLYHMLTGTPPYGGEDSTNTLMKLLSGEPPRARSIDASIPEDLEALLERAMARDTSLRVESARELADELVAFTAAGARAGEASPARRKGRARARWARLGATLLLLASVITAAAWATALTWLMVSISSDAPAEDELLRFFVVGAPVAVALLGVLTGASAIVGRWRSSPEVQVFARALARGLVTGLGTLALGTLALVARDAFAAASAVTAVEQTVVFAVAGFLAFVVFFASKS
jgi:serine/threonine-protein kinase